MPHYLSSEKLAHIEQLAYALGDAIHSGEREKILAAQQALTAEAIMDWEQIQQSEEFSPKDKALARLLAGAAIKDLPTEIQDPKNYPQILTRLRLLKNTMQAFIE